LASRSRFYEFLLSGGHCFTDVNQGALSAMLPFVMTSYHYGYAKVSTLVLGCSIVSSVVQPLFGWIGDKTEKPWIMSLGCFLAGLGIALMGVFHHFPLLFACTMLTGIGVALFHPEGGRLAHQIANEKKGTAMGDFSVGGNLGFVFGPLFVALLFPYFGMRGALFFIIPSTIFAILLLKESKKLTVISHKKVKEASLANKPLGIDNWVEFWKVIGTNILRSIVSRNFIVYLPLFWVAFYHKSNATGSIMVMVFTLVGAVATFFGGRLGDRIGFKKCLVLCSGLLLISVAAFAFTNNIILATIFVMLAGTFIDLAYGTGVALAQSYLPNHLGLASGISIGLVVSIGALASPFLGMASDATGSLKIIFFILTGVCVLTLLLTLILKNDR
jgi:FSR family fosmidomycin resistance protein-like MFS transporter